MAAARYKILKKNRLQAVIKFIGTGTSTVQLSELALADETPINPESDITFSYWNAPTNSLITIKRGSNDIEYLSGGDNWNLSQGTGFTDNEFADQPITVVTTGDSTVILCVNKSGWKVPEAPQGTGR